MSKKRRLGRIIVSLDYVAGLVRGEGLNLQHDLGVIFVERDHFQDRATILAYCEQFDEIDEGHMPPVYVGSWTNDSPYPTWVRAQEG